MTMHWVQSRPAPKVSRPRGLALAASLTTGLLLAAALSGCGHKATSPYQPAPPPDPDLRAVGAFLNWGTIGIGGSDPTRSAPPRGNARAASGSFDVESTVVVGTGSLPALQMLSTGISADYHVHFYVDDKLWWDVDAFQRPIPSGWYDLFGQGWVPADTGIHVLRMVVDAQHQIPEVDETNNEQRFAVHVIPGDLVAGRIDFIQWVNGYPYDVTSAKVGTPVQVVTMSFARGNYTNHRAVLNACGTPLMDHRVTLWGGTLFPDIRTDTLTFTPSTAGTCEFRFDVDPDGEFPIDSSRNDNTCLRTLTVAP